MGIRLVVVDDNPHLAWDGATYPANATFERFVAALLDVPGVAGRLDHDVRAGSRRPRRRRRACRSTRGSGSWRRRRSTGSPGTCAICPGCFGPTDRRCRAAIADADLVWIKVPASNAALAGAIAARAGVPRFVWVAGSAGDVAAGRFAGGAGRRWPGHRRRL